MARIQGRMDMGDALVGPLMQRAIKIKTEQIARNVRAQGIKVGDKDGGPHEYELPVKVEMTTTDRAKGRVVINHPAGEAVQAKHGALTRAASEAGMEVTDR